MDKEQEDSFGQNGGRAKKKRQSTVNEKEFMKSSEIDKQSPVRQKRMTVDQLVPATFQSNSALNDVVSKKIKLQ